MDEGSKGFLDHLEFCRLIAEGKLGEEHKLSNRIIKSMMDTGCGNTFWESNDEVMAWMHIVLFMETYIEELETEVSKSQYTEGLKALRERVAEKMKEKERELEPVPRDDDW